MKSERNYAQNSQNFLNTEKQEQKVKKRFFIKPFTVYNFEEKQLLTLRPRNCIYKDRGDGILICERVGYLVMKITPMVEEMNSQTKN